MRWQILQQLRAAGTDTEHLSQTIQMAAGSTLCRTISLSSLPLPSS